MKTTMEVSDALFNSAKALAHVRNISLDALVEEGLRRVLAEAQAGGEAAFRLEDARVHGEEVLIADPKRWLRMAEES